MKEIVTNKFNLVINLLSNLGDHDGRSSGDGGNRPPRHRLKCRAASAGLCAGGLNEMSLAIQADVAFVATITCSASSPF